MSNQTTFYLPLFSLLSLAACTGAAPVGTSSLAQSDTTSNAPASGAQFTDGLHWFRNSAEYQTLSRQTFKLAAKRVDEYCAGGASSGWGVVLDADETILDNSQYQKERLGQGFSPESWDAWVKRRQAGATPGSVAFTQHVHDTGGSVVVITNRTAYQCSDTQDNLSSLGFAFDEVLCAPDAKTSDKNSRFQAVMAGTDPSTLPALDVVVFMGDNIKDFPDLDQSIRTADESAFLPFGEKYFQMPNPMYGSWMGNPAE